jgi:ABC-type nitrate/sulfonate/bicarbonate transport system ATPase subunit/ABC-type nitrate/sulfonate/bicarbonate transport system permease component
MCKVFVLGINRTKWLESWLGSALPFITLAVAWHLFSRTGVIETVFLPTPSQTFDSFLGLASNNFFLEHLVPSVKRVATAFLLSVLVAFPVGVLSGQFPFVSRIVYPLCGFSRYLPVAALVPLCILWFGIDDIQKVAVITLGVFFQLVLLIANDTASVPKELIEAGYTFGLTRLEIVRRIVLPWSMPAIWDDLRISAGWAWSYLVLAELVAGSRGVGYFIIQSQRYLETDRVFAGILMIGILGVLTDLAFRFTGARLFMGVRESGVLLEFKNAEKIYVDEEYRFVHALEKISFSVREGEFVAIIGPSGCGKSTLLRLAAGLEQASAGEVSYEGQLVKEPNRRCGFVFQSYNAFPWLTVHENIAFGLRRTASILHQDKVSKWLEVTGLSEFAERYPKTLSGGMRQRLALARAMIVEPKLLLLDEPFGALDERTRESMQYLLLQVVANSGCTVLFVTHGIREAIFLADRIILLSPRPGKILEIFDSILPKPRSREHLKMPEFSSLYERIADRFIA